ncbi:MAG: hypothetical protein PHO56_04345 [Patescibacteria group bacterium]|nr:hypothetical protein [Patescibacteria group bacterium]
MRQNIMATKDALELNFNRCRAGYELRPVIKESKGGPRQMTSWTAPGTPKPKFYFNHDISVPATIETTTISASTNSSGTPFYEVSATLTDAPQAEPMKPKKRSWNFIPRRQNCHSFQKGAEHGRRQHLNGFPRHDLN